MENASKALLIAASVLIAIVLIAIGVRILNSTAGSIDESATSDLTTETQVFNQKFIKYLGKNKTKAEVISLIDTVISNNASNDIKVGIKYTGENYSYEINDINSILSSISGIEGNEKFWVQYEYDKGYNSKLSETKYLITKISIQIQSSTEV